jgi:predicted phosphodiesterase
MLYQRLRLTQIIALAALTILTSCDMLDYHPYDVYVTGEKFVNNKNIARIESACANKDTIRFAATGDTQGWYDETEDFVKDVNKRDSIDFVVHTGDLTNYGVTNEFLWQRDILNKLNVPYVCVIGNHDCLGTGEFAFRRIFGETNTYFIAGRVKFVMLNTNALEYDYSKAIPDIDFIESQDTIRRSEFDRSIVTMHAHPYADVFNNNFALSFEHAIMRLPHLMFCMNGHDHTMMQTTRFNDGLMYYQTASINQRKYYIFTVTPSGYTYEIITY